MNRSESIVEISKALAAVQAEMKPAINNAINPYFNSEYADYEAVKDAAQPYLTKNKLAVIHVPWVQDGRMYLECVVLHESGQWISGMYPVNPVKNDPQSIGAAVTYAKRYSFSAMVGVVTKDDDDDGNAATKPQRPGDNMRRDGSTKPAPKTQNQALAQQVKQHIERPPQNNPAMENALPARYKGVTEKQMGRLYAIAGAKKYNHDGVHVYLKETFNIKSAKELTREQYDQACNYFLNEPASDDEVPF